MKKRIVAILLMTAMTVSLLAGCRNSEETNAVTKDIETIGYDPKEAVKDFEFGELNETEKDYVIEMGYFNCDHMVGSIIGEKAGIYEALGLKVNITKSGETLKALTSGSMDVGYTGVEGAIRSVNQGAPFFIAAANHMGGSMYLVASNEIETFDDLKGKTLAITAKPEVSPTILTWNQEYGMSADPADYNIVNMGSSDAMFALKAGQIDGFSCCDPYASIAEFEGFGHIMAIDWAAPNISSESDYDDWGLCCVYAMNTEFSEKCPELARRLIYAHSLAIKFMYEHPYNAAMMFADGFDVDPYVALRTIYMKTVSEGRTLTWKFNDSNVDAFLEYYTQFEQIPEEEIPYITDRNTLISSDVLEAANIEDFETYIKEVVDPIMPLGTTFEDWYNIAKEIDGISDEEAVDISDTATSYLNKDLADRTSK